MALVGVFKTIKELIRSDISISHGKRYTQSEDHAEAEKIDKIAEDFFHSCLGANVLF